MIGFASEKQIRDLSDNDLLDTFGSASDDVRKAILSKAVKALSKTRLKKILTAYSDQDAPRYYNVFYWLDLGISLRRKQVLHAIEVVDRKRR